MKAIRVWTALLVAFVLASCGAANADGPPEIIYGRDICVQCNMIITEIGHAAAYRLDSGEEKKFDGIGEMLIYGREHGEFAAATAWVHDYWSEEWVRAETAFYVPTRSVSSPMGHGIFGFSSHARASEFAAEVGGEAIDWVTVLQLPIIEGLVGEHRDREADGAEGDMGDHGAHDQDMTEHDMEGDA